MPEDPPLPKTTTITPSSLSLNRSAIRYPVASTWMRSTTRSNRWPSVPSTPSTISCNIEPSPRCCSTISRTLYRRNKPSIHIEAYCMCVCVSTCLYHINQRDRYEVQASLHHHLRHRLVNHSGVGFYDINVIHAALALHGLQFKWFDRRKGTQTRPISHTHLIQDSTASI